MCDPGGDVKYFKNESRCDIIVSKNRLVLSSKVATSIFDSSGKFRLYKFFISL